MPVRTYKLLKRKSGMGPQKELLLDSCPAMELPSPDLASASYESELSRHLC